MLNATELGKKTSYATHYDPKLLFPIARAPKREDIEISKDLPFYGVDIWNHYEVSWLDPNGKPRIALAEIIYGCDSSHIIESKSMKLYFNSLNNTCFKDVKELETTIYEDLKIHINSKILNINLIPAPFAEQMVFKQLDGISIDHLEVVCSVYTVEPNFLQTEDILVSEILCSDLLKSNCLVTNQPDWCSIQIAYRGKKINREGLLQYLVSYRNTNEFHEPCIEKIFMHILKQCNPEELSVYGRSTRRGGIDINAFRTTLPDKIKNIDNKRLLRQ